MTKSLNAFRLAEHALSGGADLKGSVNIIAGERSMNCDLKLNGNNKGHLIGAWGILHAMVEYGITDLTMDELIGALDILNELINQTQPKED